MLICRVRYQEFKEASKYNTHTRNKRLILGIQFKTCCRRPKHISFRSFFDHFCHTSCGFLRNNLRLEFCKHAMKAKLLFCFAFYYVMYRVFSHDVTAAILVSQNNKQQPCWCPEPILWELNSFLRQTLSFFPINLYRCWPGE